MLTIPPGDGHFIGTRNSSPAASPTAKNVLEPRQRLGARLPGIDAGGPARRPAVTAALRAAVSNPRRARVRAAARRRPVALQPARRTQQPESRIQRHRFLLLRLGARDPARPPRRGNLPARGGSHLGRAGAVRAGGRAFRFVQQPGAEPGQAEQYSTAPYGVGAFLLAGVEVHLLRGDEAARTRP
jgi:hypothetical protein